MNDKPKEFFIDPSLLGNVVLNPFHACIPGVRGAMFTAHQKIRTQEMKTLTATEQKNNG